MLLTKIIAGLVMLSVLVVIHEFGHFIVARLFKIGVPVFSVGMGPRIAGFEYNGTDYRLSALPIGGYVMMSGADPFGEADPDTYVDPDEDFMRKPVWQRLLVMFAGPGANLLLPIFLLTAVLFVGEDRSAAVVGMVHPDTPAAEAGVRPDDRLVAVDGEPVELWSDVMRRIQDRPGAPITLTVDRAGEPLEVALPPDAFEVTRDGFADLSVTGLSWMQKSSQVGVDDPTSPAGRAGIRTGDGIVAVGDREVRTWRGLEAALAEGDSHTVTLRRAAEEAGEVETLRVPLERDPTWSPPHPEDPWADNEFGLVPVMLFVGSYGEDSAAADAGVELDDRILLIDGSPVRDWNELIQRVSATQTVEDIPTTAGGCMRGPPEPPAARAMTLTVVREGEVHELELVPRMTRELVRTQVAYRPLIGVMQYPNAFVDGELVFKRYGLLEAVPEAARESVAVLGATFDVLGQFLTRERQMRETIGGPIAIFDMAGTSAEMGLGAFARLMAAISIGLAVINLLPVPVLDGGQILFYSIEGIRGRPLSVAIREKIQMIGVLFLVGLILIVSVHDISRVISGG